MKRATLSFRKPAKITSSIKTSQVYLEARHPFFKITSQTSDEETRHPFFQKARENYIIN
jgi:hypothetical protein